ncbi:Protein M3 [Rhodosporidiobolus nylandii]
MSDVSIPPINALIWLAVKPIIKLAIPTAVGFCLSRVDLFPAAASRGASQVILNCTLPALLFSKIVPSITPQNATSIGPIFLIGFVYLALSLLLGVLVRVFLPTPRNFRWGILLAAAPRSNASDAETTFCSRSRRCPSSFPFSPTSPLSGAPTCLP